VGTMKEFDFQHWWNLVAAAGVIIAVIFFVAQLNHGFLFGLGLLLFGIGERINHPVRSKLPRGESGGSSSTSVTESYPREPTGFGISLDTLGIVLIGISLFLAVLAP
jgi:hypothetical protein